MIANIKRQLVMTVKYAEEFYMNFLDILGSLVMKCFENPET